MSEKPEQVHVTPSVLVWARERAGYTVETVAGKLGIKPDRVRKWEVGEIPLTLGRLETLAHLYRRPSALFFLPRPPTESAVQSTDFRKRTARRPPSPTLLFQIRRASEQANIAIMLREELGEAVPNFSFRCSLEEAPEQAGTRLREALRVSGDEQVAWRGNFYTALGRWRDAAERVGVLVFQAPRKDLDEVRGFSVWGEKLSVSIVSSGDTPASRCFTLLHELTHLGLRETGLCDLHDDGVEDFCNRSAAAALMPETIVNDLMRRRGIASWTGGALTANARYLCVSEQALALRLVELRHVSLAFYREHRAHFDQIAESARNRPDDEERREVRIPQGILAISRNGRGFTRLVLDAYQRGNITAHRASIILNIGAKYLGDLSRDVAPRGPAVTQ